MDSAIPGHLQCPRTRHRRIPDDYAPPHPSAVALRQIVQPRLQLKKSYLAKRDILEFFD